MAALFAAPQPQGIDLRKLYFGTPAPATISAPRRTLTQTLNDAVNTLGRKAGLGKRMAGKIASLADLNPITPAFDAGADLRQGNYLQGTLGALLSLFPDGGGTVSHSIIAPLFHGSAAKFERFADDFIGTGEGAQGYGFGHYLTESKRLAQNYRNPKLDTNYTPGSGHLYETSVDANPEDFLNMDAALRDQPKAVQDLARSADLSHLSPTARQRVMLERYRRGEEQQDYPATLQQLHSAMTDYAANIEANQGFSQAIGAMGYKGLRYGQPKNALGGGGLNYVVFDPSIIDVLNRY